MKKLMIAAAAAAMIGGAYADSCTIDGPVGCRAWDVKMKLKSLGPKKIKCTDASDPCDVQDGVVYYLDNVTRNIKGYLWVCEYECGKAFNVCLWDSKNNLAIIPVAEEAVEFEDVFVYGKKATKVAGTIVFEGSDLEGYDTIAVTASGLNGKLVRGGAEEDCYVKSLSGYAAGKLAYIKDSSTTLVSKGGLCDEPVTCDVGGDAAKILELCNACCFEGWCDADDAEDLIPAVGTWSMKYNKSVSKGNKAISSLVPAYAL